MKILALNCGSSSVKHGLFEMGNREERLAGGVIERIGRYHPGLTEEASREIIRDDLSIRAIQSAVMQALESLTDPEHGVNSIEEIEAIGHRVVHGGERFASSVLIDDRVVRALHDYACLAPLHNPFNIIGIEVVRSILPNVPQVAVFDTAFHLTMPPSSYIYALPYELYERHRIRRYGFHGISHRYVVQEAARFMGRPPEELRLISCHLGSGASVAAIKYGQSLDTSMGFTPLEGLVMGTRCGDLDPSIIFFLMHNEGLDEAEVQELLNRKSGLLGVSGFTSDVRELEKAVYKDTGHRILNVDHPHHGRAKLALDVFNFRLKKYIGAYAAAMGGVDAVIFTGGIGEGSITIPEDACAEMEFMGIEIGSRINLGGGRYELSKLGSQVRVLVMPADEQLMIARETHQIVR